MEPLCIAKKVRKAIPFSLKICAIIKHKIKTNLFLNVASKVYTAFN